MAFLAGGFILAKKHLRRTIQVNSRGEVEVKSWQVDRVSKGKLVVYPPLETESHSLGSALLDSLNDGFSLYSLKPENSGRFVCHAVVEGKNLEAVLDGIAGFVQVDSTPKVLSNDIVELPSCSVFQHKNGYVSLMASFDSVDTVGASYLAYAACIDRDLVACHESVFGSVIYESRSNDFQKLFRPFFENLLSLSQKAICWDCDFMLTPEVVWGRIENEQSNAPYLGF